MDLSNRNPQAAINPIQSAGSASGRHNKSSVKENKDKWVRAGIVSAIAAVVILLVGLILLVSTNNNNNKNTEAGLVNSSKLQAVFLNTGQVYFGNVKALNKNYIVLNNIYYLQTSNANGSATSSSTANSNVTLVKLGCELHRPDDQMVINRTQVTFWENLQETGQVAKAVATFEKQNPNGQKCADQSTSSGNTSSAVQNAGSSAH